MYDQGELSNVTLLTVTGSNRMEIIQEPQTMLSGD